MTTRRIGIDLGGTKIEGVVLDDRGVELAKRRVATPRDDYAATVEAVAGLVEALDAETAETGESAAAGAARSASAPAAATIGVGTPGAVSPATGLMKNANSVWLNSRPLQQDLEARLGRAIRMANDADCFTLSEAVDGSAAGHPVVFGVILGTGVGGGFAVEGRLVRGPNAIAGEWGHNPLPWSEGDERPGAPCYCGQTGCIETFLSGPGLSADYRRHTGEAATSEAIVAAALGNAPAGGVAAASGDPGPADPTAARGVLDRYAHRLARGLASVINLLDPHAIVLGGGLSRVAYLYEAVPRLWPEFVFSDRVDTLLLPPKHGDASGVRGAARLWEG